MLKTISLLLITLVATTGIHAGPLTQEQQQDAVQTGDREAQLAFFNHLSSRCGAHYVGETEYPQGPDAPFKGERLVAHIAQCSADEIRIPFHVGEDHSRTWIFELHSNSLTFRHDHRHSDGTPDEITDYGGQSRAGGTALQQFFPADEHTATLIPEAATNVWTVTLSEDGNTLVYYLERHNAARFKATLRRVD